jgi:hypothetical protein
MYLAPLAFVIYLKLFNDQKNRIVLGTEVTFRTVLLFPALLVMTSTTALAPALASTQCPLKPLNVEVSLDADEGELVFHNDLDRYDLERLRREKTAKSLKKNWWPVGFTVAEKHFNLTSHAKVVALGAQQFCGVLRKVAIKLEFSRIDVYVSSEFRPGSCPYKETLAHENIHVSIFRNTLKRYSALIRTELERAVQVSEAASGSNPQEVVDELQRRVKNRIDPYFQQFERDQKEANAAIDTPENYRQEQLKCPLW